MMFIVGMTLKAVKMMQFLNFVHDSGEESNNVDLVEKNLNDFLFLHPMVFSRTGFYRHDGVCALDL